MKPLVYNSVFMLRTTKAHLAMLKAQASKEGSSLADLCRRKLGFSKKAHGSCPDLSPAGCADESSTPGSPPSNTPPASDGSADTATPLT